MSRPNSISFGHGLLLVTESHLYQQFAPFGFSERGFRLFLRALGVPHLRTPSGDLLYDMLSFKLALKLIMRMGEMDFMAPGDRKKAPPATYRTVLPKPSRDHWKAALTELLLSYELTGSTPAPARRASFEKAIDRILAVHTHLQREVIQPAYTEAGSKVDDVLARTEA